MCCGCLDTSGDAIDFEHCFDGTDGDTVWSDFIMNCWPIEAITHMELGL